MEPKQSLLDRLKDWLDDKPTLTQLQLSPRQQAELIQLELLIDSYKKSALTHFDTSGYFTDHDYFNYNAKVIYSFTTVSVLPREIITSKVDELILKISQRMKEVQKNNDKEKEFRLKRTSTAVVAILDYFDPKPVKEEVNLVERDTTEKLAVMTLEGKIKQTPTVKLLSNLTHGLYVLIEDVTGSLYLTCLVNNEYFLLMQYEERLNNARKNSSLLRVNVKKVPEDGFYRVISDYQVIEEVNKNGSPL